MIFAIGMCQLALGQTVITETINTPGTGTWTVPCGVTFVTIAVYGGGGGGGGSNTNSFCGGGGGAGGYAQADFVVTPGTVIPYLVGAGGVGGGPAGQGGFGQQSNIQPFSGLQAFGGTGGMPASVGGAGGVGGTGSPWATNITGQTGVNGNGVIGGQGGNAGGPDGGSGGTGGAPGINGGTGNLLGGGGGGAGKKLGGVNPFGGAGSPGGVTFTYTLPYDIPDAGANQSSCDPMFMTANTPTAPWTGQWSIVSFTGGVPPVIANINDPNTQVTPAVGSCATLQWTFTQPGCQTMFDQVDVCWPLLCNDDPCGATPMTVNTGACSYTTFSNVNGTGSTGMVEPGCGSYADNDAWYSLTVPPSGVVTLNSTDLAGGNAMIIGMAIYSEGSGGCNDMIHEGCDAATTATDIAELTYTGTPGETIYVRIWERNELEGFYQICAFEPAAAQGQIVPGANTITCGSSYTFYDPGGNGGNYQNNVSAQYVICPSTPGQYVTIDFTTGPLTFNTQTGWDILTVVNGAADSSYMIGQYSGTEASGPGIITSSSPDGCLTIIFESDQSTTAAGWLASVSCTSTPGVNDSTCTATDCPGECGTWICSSGLYPAENIGNNFEEMTGGNAGCFDNVGEVATNWFYFTALTAGSIEFTFQGPGGQDYNFAIYGPTMGSEPPCPQYTNAPPILCSQADVGSYSINGSTGINAVLGAGQSYEGTEGDGWVDALYVTPGETYAMIVNIYQNGGPQPVIDLTIGGTGTLDCTPVYAPVEVHSLRGINQGDHNLITWVSASERNNDFYTVERSINGYDWEFVGQVDGAGNSAHSLYYSLNDYNPYYPVTYYRLSQTDYDGTARSIGTVAVNSLKSDSEFVTDVFPNPANDYVTFTFSGHDTKTPLIVSVVNALGEVVHVEAHDNLYDGMPMTMRTDMLSGGMYQVVFSQGDQRAVQRLTVIN